MAASGRRSALARSCISAWSAWGMPCHGRRLGAVTTKTGSAPAARSPSTSHRSAWKAPEPSHNGLSAQTTATTGFPVFMLSYRCSCSRSAELVVNGGCMFKTGEREYVPVSPTNSQRLSFKTRRASLTRTNVATSAV